MDIEEIRKKIDSKTKPLGALGLLENIAFKIAVIQQNMTLKLVKPVILVFAGDHGIADEGVSAYPAEVTSQMVENFLTGGAAINVFCKQNEIDLLIIDSGVRRIIDSPYLIDKRIAPGTESFLYGKAMTEEQAAESLLKGGDIVRDMLDTACNIIGFGEMGIGNTSSASMIMSCVCGLDLDVCVGRGTGVKDEQLRNKLSILRRAREFHGHIISPEEILQTFGGFEIAQMTGAMLAAFDKGMILMIDGFIATSAFLVAYKMNPDIINNALFSHVSNESGHRAMLEFLDAEPILNINLRLGEGTGCAIAYPLIKSAVAFFNEMASFDGAGVSNKE